MCTPVCVYVCVYIRKAENKDLMNLNLYLHVWDFCAMRACWGISACICEAAPVCSVPARAIQSKGSVNTSWELCVCVCVGLGYGGRERG